MEVLLGFVADVGRFLWAVFVHWWNLFALIVGLITPFTFALGNRRTEALKKKWGTRGRQIQISVLMLAFIGSAFVAFNGEFHAKQSAEGATAAAQKKLKACQDRPQPAPTPAQCPAPTAPTSVPAKEQPRHLIRYLEASHPTVEWDFLAPDGIHALEAKNGVAFVLNNFQVTLANHSDELLTWKISSLSITLDGRPILSLKNGPSSFWPQGTKRSAFTPISPEVKISSDNSVIKAVYRIEYDTVPATGVRVTGATLVQSLKWYPADNVNFFVPRPEPTWNVVDPVEN